MRQRLVVLGILSIYLLGCGQTEKHDLDTAGRLALEFGQAAFVQNRADESYKMLSEGMKNHVDLTQFWITIGRLHSDGYPTSIKLTGIEIERAEKQMVYVYLAGKGTAGQNFCYRITMEGSADLGYKVALFRRLGCSL